MASAMSMESYYCHACDAHVSPVTEEVLCPNCQGGFVERITEENNSGISSAMEDSNSAQLFQSTAQHGHNPFEQVLMNLLVGSRNPPNHGSGGREGAVGIRYRPSSRRTQSDAMPFNTQPSSSEASSSEALVSAATARVPGLNEAPAQPEVFVHEVLRGALGGGLGGPLFPIPLSGAHFPWNFMELHGNPNDYAWGPSGLDDIISFLLGQLENAGPPPASSQAIESLPTIDIDAVHVESGKDCSVCMEVFKLNEKAKKLPCSHFFHVACIEPWLKLHNTCPICRKLVEDTSACPSTSANNSYSYFQTTDDHTYAE